MITPPFTRIIWGKKQKMPSPKRAQLWLRRLSRAQAIIDCHDKRFRRRWAPTLEASGELQDALSHRRDLDLWLDAMLIIDERQRYYRQFV